MNAFQRKFVNEVRRCDEMERKLRYIEAEVHKDGVHVPDVKEPPRAPNPREIIDLEVSEFEFLWFELIKDNRIIMTNSGHYFRLINCLFCFALFISSIL